MFSVHMTGTALGHGQAPGTLYGIIIEIIESTLNIKYMFLFERKLLLALSISRDYFFVYEPNLFVLCFYGNREERS